MRIGTVKGMADVGRPQAIDDAVLAKLREAFLFGATDVEACLFAGIHPATLYRYQEANPEYSEEKEQLKQNPVMLARQTVFSSLSKDADLSLRFLERKKKDEFSTKSEVENSGEIKVTIMKYGEPG